jgi:hypothetical protein
MNPFIKKAWPHILAVLVFIGIATAYFFPQLDGKVLFQSDIAQYKGMSKEIKDYKKKTGEIALWTNSMFGGMPTYQIDIVKSGNVTSFVQKLYQLKIPSPIGRFFVAMLSFYILMILLGSNYLVSLLGAVSFAFTTNNFLLYEAGHVTKLGVISYLPLLAAGLILAFRRKYLLGGVLFALGSAFSLSTNHPQMLYYFFLTLVIYGVVQLVKDYQKGELAQFGKSVGVLFVGGILGLGSVSSNLWTTLEYSKDTMRGKPILEVADNGQPKSSSETDGLDWEYAMQWSNGTLDCFASFIPGLVGGGSQEPIDASSASFKSLRSQGYNVKEPIGAPLYWGKLPFTSGPAYFGAAIIFLFLMGMILVKGPVKWWLVLGTLFTFLLSMGKNMAFLNEFFFNYVPLFNKFRTPNSVLSVTAMLVPILSLLTVDHLVKGKSSKKEVLTSLYIAAGIAGAICLYFILAGSGMYDFAHPGDAGRAPFTPEALAMDRAALMRSDAIRTLLIVLASAAVVWAFIQNKIKQVVLIAGLGVIVFFDLWTVGKRYLNETDFIRKSKLESNFAPRPADTQILKDIDPNFRVYDASENTFQSTKTSYFHKSIGGYHAAKLQRFQDLIDRHIGQGNQKVLDMLNTKYFIVPGQQQGAPAQVQQNPGAMGNAWFVSELNIVPNANAEIDALKDFNPREVAVIHQEFSDYIGAMNVQKNGSIELTEYKPNQLTYHSNSTTEQFAVFSEIWYGPDKGWKATVDGKEVEFIRTNYALRGMKLAAGEHTIVFRFDPDSYRIGTILSFIFSSMILLGLGFIIYKNIMKWKENETQKPAPDNAPVKQKVKRKGKK